MSAQKLAKLGLNTCQDVRDFGEPLLVKQFGKFGRAFTNERWALISEASSPSGFANQSAPSAHSPLTMRIPARDSSSSQNHGRSRRRYEPYKERGIRSLQVKLKFSDFSQTTMERKAERCRSRAAKQLMVDAWTRGDGKSVRLIGVGVSLKDPTLERSAAHAV